METCNETLMKQTKTQPPFDITGLVDVSAPSNAVSIVLHISGRICPPDQVMVHGARTE